MKTLFDEPIYKAGSFFYQQTGGDVIYRWRLCDSVRWSENCKCNQDVWKEFVLDKGAICEDVI